MNSDIFVITFPNATKDEANKYASDLADNLSQAIAGLERVEPARETEDTMDFGTSLVVVLGTAAATALAKGIQSWLRRVGVTAELRQNGTLKLSNLESKDVAAIAAALSRR